MPRIIVFKRAAQAGDATISKVMAGDTTGIASSDKDKERIAAEQLASEEGKTPVDEQVIRVIDEGISETTKPSAAGHLDNYSKEDLKQMIIEKDAELISLQNALAVNYAFGKINFLFCVSIHFTGNGR